MKDKLKITITREHLKKKEFDKVMYENLDNDIHIQKNEDNIVKILGYIYKENYLKA